MQKYANFVELRKCCQTAYVLAKFRFDTDENEPAKKFANLSPPVNKYRSGYIVQVRVVRHLVLEMQIRAQPIQKVGEKPKLDLTPS